jgi:hypothetical protein
MMMMMMSAAFQFHRGWRGIKLCSLSGYFNVRLILMSKLQRLGIWRIWLVWLLSWRERKRNEKKLLSFLFVKLACA